MTINKDIDNIHTCLKDAFVEIYSMFQANIVGQDGLFLEEFIQGSASSSKLHCREFNSSKHKLCNLIWSCISRALDKCHVIYGYLSQANSVFVDSDYNKEYIVLFSLGIIDQAIVCTCTLYLLVGELFN